MTTHWKAIEQHFTAVCSLLPEYLSILDLALLGVKALTVNTCVLRSASQTGFTTVFNKRDQYQNQ